MASAQTSPASSSRHASPTFQVSLAGVDVRAAEVISQLASIASLRDGDSFNQFCKRACELWKSSFPQGLPGEARAGELFTGLLSQISPSNAETIPTPWGGVVIKKHEHPHVEKWLVIKEGGYLALEHHSKKQERIEVREGVGILLSGKSPESSQLTLRIMTPGTSAKFAPGEVHCLIGCQDVAVWEVSEDHLGMDKDLLFIFTPVA